MTRHDHFGIKFKQSPQPSPDILYRASPSHRCDTDEWDISSKYHLTLRHPDNAVALGMGRASLDQMEDNTFYR
jgi:hypothetical protein